MPVKSLENVITKRWVLFFIFKSTGLRDSLPSVNVTHNIYIFREGLTEWSSRTFSWFPIHSNVTRFFDPVTYMRSIFYLLFIALLKICEREKHWIIIPVIRAASWHCAANFEIRNFCISRNVTSPTFSRVQCTLRLPSSRNEKPRSQKLYFPHPHIPIDCNFRSWKKFSAM